MKVKTAIIPAAGFGTRFLPIVKEIPKEMLPLINKPIIQLVVDECIDAGIEKVVIVVRKGNNVVEDYFRKSIPEVRDLLISVGKEDRYVEIERLEQYKQLVFINTRDDLPYGNGSPILSALNEVLEGEPFAVCFSDDLVLSSKSGIGQLIDYYDQHEDVDGVIACQEVKRELVTKYGIIKPKVLIDEKHGQVESIVEKPDIEDAPSNFVTYGRYVLPYEVMEVLAKVNTGLDNELWLSDANHEIAQKGKLMYKVIDGQWYTTGDPQNYFEALTRYYLADLKYSKRTKEFLKTLVID